MSASAQLELDGKPRHELKMDKKHRYTCECGHESCAGVVFRSVTTILGDAIPKELGWWGMTIGVAGVHKLLKARKIRLAQLPEEWVKALTAAKLTVNHKRDDGATRGKGVHDALEDFGNTGKIRSLGDFPVAHRGYWQGVARFLTRYKPKFAGQEIRVLSTKHAFAGTFDVLCWIDAGLLASGGEPGTETGVLVLCLIDLKTSKYVYPCSHFAQLEAYEGARVEQGEDPTGYRGVLWVTTDGHMELVESTATFDDFLVLKASAEVITRLGTIRKTKKQKAAA